MRVMDEGAIQAVAEYVRSRRGGMTVAEASRRASLSTRKWHQVEAGEGHHRDTTLMKIAEGLGESPARLFDIAGLPFAEQDVEPSIADRLRRVEEETAELRSLLQRLADEVAQLDTPRSASRRAPGSKR